MTKKWTPSAWGRILTGSPEWRLLQNGLDLSLTSAGQSYSINVEDESSYRVHQGVFWTDITLHPGRANEVKVDGLPNAQRPSLIAALEAVLTEKRTREDVAFLQRVQQAMSDWFVQTSAQEEAAKTERRWFTHEMQAALEAARPVIDVSAVRARLKQPGVRARLRQQTTALEVSLTLWEADRRVLWSTLNTLHTESELEACKDLFDRVESKPLTDEQSRAVICFDNRVQVVASAGSGKTSTMVAKAAYAIHRGFVAPEHIILLAFNKQAAEELKERAAKSFERLGMEGIEVEAATFHALGLRIIGKATGEKPDIPDWATDTAGGLRKLTEIIDQLKDRSPDLPPRGTPETMLAKHRSAAPVQSGGA